MKKLFSVVAVTGLATFVGSFDSNPEQRFDYKKGVSNSSVDIEEPQTILNPDGSKVYFAPVITVEKPPTERTIGGFIGFGKRPS